MLVFWGKKITVNTFLSLFLKGTKGEQFIVKVYFKNFFLIFVSTF